MDRQRWALLMLCTTMDGQIIWSGTTDKLRENQREVESLVGL